MDPRLRRPVVSAPLQFSHELCMFLVKAVPRIVHGCQTHVCGCSLQMFVTDASLFAVLKSHSTPVACILQQ